MVPGPGGAPPGFKGKGSSGQSGLTDGASGHVKDLANYLIDKLIALLAPKETWAPAKADGWVYSQFLWLGQHLAIAIFTCVIVVGALTAWQGTPRLKQMGASTGWTLAAVAGMASVPGVVTLLNEAVSASFRNLIDKDESSLFGAIRADLSHGADANPVGYLIIVAALCVAIAFAALVFMSRTLGIILFVCMAPLVLASLARGGDMQAVKTWAMRLLGLLFCPFVLALTAPFVSVVQGSLAMDAVLLLLADALMLRMIWHGVPYFGPKIAGAVRSYVESHTANPTTPAGVRASVVAQAVVGAGSPRFYEEQNTLRGPRTVPTVGRAISQDRGVLLGAYGLRQQRRAGQLTTESAVDKARREAPRRQQLLDARRQARESAEATPASGPAAGPGPASGSRPPRPAPRPAPSPTRGAPPPPRTP